MDTDVPRRTLVILFPGVAASAASVAVAAEFVVVTIVLEAPIPCWRKRND